MAENFQELRERLAIYLCDSFKETLNGEVSQNLCIGLAHMIIGTRQMGAENFILHPGTKYMSDLKPNLRATLRILSEIPTTEKLRVQSAMHWRRKDMNEDTNQIPIFSELEKQIQEIILGIEFRKKKVSGSAERKKAHRNTDWTKVSTVKACCHAWGEANMELNTPKWVWHSRNAPPDPKGRQSIDPHHIKEYWDSFAPKTVNRELPSAFGQFLQNILDFFHEGDADPPNASDSLAAFRRVQRAVEGNKLFANKRL